MSSSFLVDTNVLSELMRSQPDVHVLEWFDAHIDAQCFTSSVTKAEIFLGIALLPEGSRQTQLAKAAVKMFAEDFSDRCLSFDDKSALRYAELVSQRTRSGKPVSEYSGESVPPIPGESVPGIPRYNVPPIPGQSVPPF